MNETTKTILANMVDTKDPVEGAVFEKEVETNLEDFTLFLLTYYRNVTMEQVKEDGNLLYLFYNGPDATDHIATYIPCRNKGCFGGSRVGSQNTWRKPGDPEVDNPFDPENNDNRRSVEE